MDFDTMSEAQIKDLFIGLRQSVMDDDYNDEENAAYFTLLEYVVSKYGQEAANDWNLEADLSSKRVESPVGSSPSSKEPSSNGQMFSWPLVIAAAAILFMWRK